MTDPTDYSVFGSADCPARALPELIASIDERWDRVATALHDEYELSELMLDTLPHPALGTEWIENSRHRQDALMADLDALKLEMSGIEAALSKFVRAGGLSTDEMARIANISKRKLVTRIRVAQRRDVQR